MPSSSSINPNLSSGIISSAVKANEDERLAELKQVFTEFTAGTFYREMLSALRKAHTKPAYFDGGHAEEVFRQQLDGQISDSLAAQHGEAFAAPMFETFAQQAMASPRL